VDASQLLSTPLNSWSLRRRRLRCFKELRDESENRKSWRSKNRTKYSYDAAGHTATYGGLSFTYNAAGRLIGAVNGSTTSSYVYNALGQRVEKTTGAGTTMFLYDESGHLLGEYDGTGNAIEEIVWLGDIPVATVRQEACGLSIFYIHTDHLNTPRRITRRSTSDVVWSWDSDPFGATAPNENPSGLGSFSFNLRFPGQFYDAETGLNYNYFRDYDPATGRYVESDPSGLNGGVNTYAYVAGNPVSWIDPYGLLPGDPFGSSGEAAADALNYINPWSIILNTEYAGIIYQDPANGQYYATPPAQGGPEGNNAWSLHYPAGKTPVGDYHTHANYTNDDNCPTTKNKDVFNSNQFSKPDLNWRPPFRPWTRYLGTPSGQYLQYVPGPFSSPSPLKF
jgi:RHS repeat-associated protein